MEFEIEYGWPDRDAVKDFIFSKKLKVTNPKNHLTKESFIKLQEIEREITPESEWLYNRFKSMRGLLKYIKCFDKSQIDCYFDEDCYLLCVRFYNGVLFYDMRSKNERYGNIFKVISYLYDNYKNDLIFAYSREKTTYPIYKRYEKRGRIEIVSDELDVYKNENYHQLTLKWINKEHTHID